ncbi:MAG: GTPase ObgE [Rhodospirillaceae bacterium]|nr:GTPase ObgE [Rhodospirillaceae bacterium]|tara:strand:+ start:516 stop:1574 length:1059 start_codon:yes stop_codon:yes gene_type:complete
MRFLDQAKIYVASGAGGNGCVGFRRERNEPRGGPDGGNGGRGGSVMALGVAELNTLIDFRYKKHFVAKRGRHGQGAHRTGADAPDLLIEVPLGTELVEEDGETLIADITRPGQCFLLAPGGDGGFGNSHYKSSTNRAPRRADPGQEGVERWVWLRLKLLADAGIVGLPNAGKSTFLSAVTRANPKIADYPFTTLSPALGVVVIDEHDFVLADIPGLIEGAHDGAGLGDRFLGHVERCAVLLHLVDGTLEDPAAAYCTVREELLAYGKGLEDKPEIVCLSKCDALDTEARKERLEILTAAVNSQVAVISGVSGEGGEDALRRLWYIISENRRGSVNAVDDTKKREYHPLVGIS